MKLGAIVAVLGVALSHAAGAQRPPAVWTPSAQAPAGTLTHALEAQRHDRFIEIARNGDIELVFFGTTSTEMWSWKDRGRSVWDRELGSLKAANFGAQGSGFKSLLWRMQNGELDGYRAKLFVLNFGPGDDRITNPFDDRTAEFVAGYGSIIAEIRVRQPQARILLLAGFPRGQLTRESWREISKLNAGVFAQLTDDETVFYADFGERFYRPDGSYNRDYWGMPGPAGIGAQVPLFDLWAEDLQPWLDRFVR
ncbi:MAG TPA: GDSL-type esterase/lipase family protein [Gammaproteobacteria bacterium]|nr:GDSL-type esterase/lipase family protein [Gammaproteobacteria bacterium]